ncbi:MAG TPA: hypothetical protein VM406_01050 [Noviherbaspirillum sp.]|nr:hypothetical protein [Noviherbaspirillum sp.]
MLSRRSCFRHFPVTGALLAALNIGPAGAQPTTGPEDTLITPVVPPMVIIAPSEIRSDPTFARGCWVRLFPAQDYKGQDDLTVAGPTDLPSLRSPGGGLMWAQRAESVLVGPKAVVTLYESPGFRGKYATLGPGAQRARLREDLAFPQSVDALRIRCK